MGSRLEASYGLHGASICELLGIAHGPVARGAVGREAEVARLAWAVDTGASAAGLEREIQHYMLAEAVVQEHTSVVEHAVASGLVAARMARHRHLAHQGMSRYCYRPCYTDFVHFAAVVEEALAGTACERHQCQSLV